jgi:hypothetical protein
MMTGHLIRIRGRYVTYFASGEALLPHEAEAVGFDFSEDAELRSHPRLRRVLTTMLRPEPKFYGVLHWSGGSDLVALDEKVKSGKAEDSDFAGALLAEPRTVVCAECQAQVRVLVVDTGQALFASDLASRLRDHDLKQSCPACGAHLGLPIVEFIGG